VAGRALSPFSRPFHHFPWNITGQKPQLLTSTGARARKVVKGPPGHGRQGTAAGARPWGTAGGASARRAGGPRAAGHRPCPPASTNKTRSPRTTGFPAPASPQRSCEVITKVKTESRNLDTLHKYLPLRQRKGHVERSADLARYPFGPPGEHDTQQTAWVSREGRPEQTVVAVPASVLTEGCGTCLSRWKLAT
jgi:hypothetical protein